MAAVPQGRASAAPQPKTLGGGEHGVPGAPPGLTAVPTHRKGRATGAARRVRKSSKLGAMFRSNPVRVMAGLVVVSAVVFGLVLLNIQVAQTSFHLSDLQRQAAELQTEQRRLRYEVARAESPERIVEMGTSLGLVAPVSQEYLHMPTIVAPEPAAQAAQQQERSSR